MLVVHAFDDFKLTLCNYVHMICYLVFSKKSASFNHCLQLKLCSYLAQRALSKTPQER
jgi:hypothetical protein